MGDNAFMLMFGYMMIANLLATLFAYKEPELALWIFIGCNIFFTIFVICGYVLFATTRLKLTENEVEAKDMAKEKKKTILKGIGLGSYFAIAIHLLNGLLSMLLDEEDFLPYIVSLDRIIASLLGGCLLGGMMYLVLRLRLKKVEE
ncbi:DUF3278 domain-containing protein [Enterococcus sp.]|uniref:DUF3278 domain-containing protein n=1 Tax=Enterococcus sp. TaxID=35783 RepID=UPI0025C15A9A|nr:DUF3278 domain-containing protein [Enterococcus sp.]